MNIGEEKKSDIEHFIQYSNLKYENEKTQKLRTFVFWYLKMQYSTIHTLYTISSDTGRCPGGFMLWRTDNSATQRRRATIFRPATAAAHITYDRHISKRQSLNAIFTQVNPNIGINKCRACLGHLD